jgi:hypothetical protein
LLSRSEWKTNTYQLQYNPLFLPVWQIFA